MTPRLLACKTMRMVLPSTGMWEDYGETGLQKGEIIFGLGRMSIGHLRRNTE